MILNKHIISHLFKWDRQKYILDDTEQSVVKPSVSEKSIETM